MRNLLLCLSLVIAGVSVHAQSKKLPVVTAPTFRKDTVTIVKFGAKSDGVTLNTKSINDAINAISKKGGGVVLIPTGMWITGPVELKSNVNLHLQKNAILQFTEDKSQYDLVASNWEGLPQMRNQSPIWATKATNIAITGSGIIDGAGDVWRMMKKDKQTETQWKKLIASGGVLSEDKKKLVPIGNFFESL